MISPGRIRKIAEEVLEDLLRARRIPRNLFACRCDPVGQETPSRRWRITFRANDFQGLGFEVSEPEAGIEEALRSSIRRRMEAELKRAGFE